MNKILRPLNMIAGIGTIAVGVLYILAFHQANTFRGILYVIFTSSLGLLLLAGDLNLSAIKNHCKFLITYIGRGFFNIFVGGWVFGAYGIFNLAQGHLTDVGAIVSLVTYIALWVLGIFFILMQFFGGKAYITEID
eukprot:CAMPEP_0176441380 /NCGR_PEP_ID=MMETSP0127-20121128/21160_1 /TAXON_ID=938130 /ORGANISM="Platyophrya macrostoma, Strain WH" /LENGTH=135 /DNA_ID=CAMNT_0017826141 /DNA_START=60 /DNA_END=467 /DNA_ORIENTATION=+